MLEAIANKPDGISVLLYILQILVYVNLFAKTFLLPYSFNKELLSEDVFMEQKKVLLVDDEPISLNMLCEFLKDSDYLYDTAINGQEALSKLESNPDAYFVVIMDRLMPFMSGMEVLEKMQVSQVLHKIPVIMLTGLGDS